MRQEQIDIWRFTRGQNQGLNTYIKTVTLPTRNRSLIIPQRDGCTSSILKRQTVPTATFQGVTYILEAPYGVSPNRRITLHGDTVVHRTRKTT